MPHLCLLISLSLYWSLLPCPLDPKSPNFSTSFFLVLLKPLSIPLFFRPDLSDTTVQLNQGQASWGLLTIVLLLFVSLGGPPVSQNWRRVYKGSREERSTGIGAYSPECKERRRRWSGSQSLSVCQSGENVLTLNSAPHSPGGYSGPLACHVAWGVGELIPCLCLFFLPTSKHPHLTPEELFLNCSLLLPALFIS
jgi:hypothetical protein